MCHGIESVLEVFWMWVSGRVHLCQAREDGDENRSGDKT